MDWPVLVWIALLAAAWFGHAFLLTVALNWTYAQPLKRNYLKLARGIIAILVMLFPVIAGLVAWRYESEPPIAATVYLLACAAVALVYLPVVSVIRYCRRLPSQIVGDTCQVIDTAAELGDKPVGNGQHWKLACLPGNQVFQVEFRDLTLRLLRLPSAWNGLTILHVSDVHFNGTPGRRFYQCLFDHVMAHGTPDILAITGDIVDSPIHHRWILPLMGRLKWSIAAFAILGNHDLYYEPELVRRRIRRLGIHMLGNGVETMTVRGEPLVVIGNEAPWFQPAPDLSPCPREAFRLCLSHTPDNFGWAQRNDIDLMLCGHVHGGQIRLPGIGPLFVPSRYSRRFDCGQFAAGPTVMSVSRGLAGREPLRYNCRPEITRIILKSMEPRMNVDERR